MNEAIYIGICGHSFNAKYPLGFGNQRVGKSTFADKVQGVLAEEGVSCHIVGFADMFKKPLQQIFRWPEETYQDDNRGAVQELVIDEDFSIRAGMIISEMLQPLEDAGLYQICYQELSWFLEAFDIYPGVTKTISITAREAQQIFGTQWGREHLGAEVWVNLFFELNKADDTVYLVPDMRMDNEIVAIKEYEGITVKIRRFMEGQPQQHVTSLPSRLEADFTVNNTSFADLQMQAELFAAAYCYVARLDSKA